MLLRKNPNVEQNNEILHVEKKVQKNVEKKPAVVEWWRTVVVVGV